MPEIMGKTKPVISSGTMEELILQSPLPLSRLMPEGYASFLDNLALKELFGK